MAVAVLRLKYIFQQSQYECDGPLENGRPFPQILIVSGCHYLLLIQMKYHYRTCPYTKMTNCCTNLSTCWEGFTLLKRTCLKKLLRLRCVVLPVDDLCVVIVVPVTDYS